MIRAKLPQEVLLLLEFSKGVKKEMGIDNLRYLLRDYAVACEKSK